MKIQTHVLQTGIVSRSGDGRRGGGGGGGASAAVRGGYTSGGENICETVRADRGPLIAKTLPDCLLLDMPYFRSCPGAGIWRTGRRRVQMTEGARGYGDLRACRCWKDREWEAGERVDIWWSDG